MIMSKSIKLYDISEVLSYMYQLPHKRKSIDLFEDVFKYVTNDNYYRNASRSLKLYTKGIGEKQGYLYGYNPLSIGYLINSINLFATEFSIYMANDNNRRKRRQLLCRSYLIF